ncbi:uncharacterized protein LOC125869626 [Solanum stenotomum]|uniref:uncharacterized protein LOC125869626 n=1 Tax=Solanum stenotomum TaxID=172797 RepID=UPI0020D0832C|nr:uncharacterized protein LOC125869626 [Solanum stenotomum]
MNQPLVNQLKTVKVQTLLEELVEQVLSQIDDTLHFVDVEKENVERDNEEKLVKSSRKTIEEEDENKNEEKKINDKDDEKTESDKEDEKGEESDEVDDIESGKDIEEETEKDDEEERG